MRSLRCEDHGPVRCYTMTRYVARQRVLRVGGLRG